MAIRSTASRLGSWASVAPQMQKLVDQRAAQQQPAQSAPAYVPPKAPGLQSDSIYETALSNIRNSLSGTEGLLNTDENALGSEYGVGFDRQGDGSLANFRIDTSNPFSKATLLQKAYDQGQKATTGGLASQGQLYSGYLQTKLQQGGEQHEQGKHELVSGFGGVARQIFQRRYEARQAAEAQKAAEAAALVGRQAQPEEIPAVATPSASGAAPQNDLQGLINRYGAANVKLTAQGLFIKNPFTGKFDIPA